MQTEDYKHYVKEDAAKIDKFLGSLRYAAEKENIWWGVSVEDRKYGLP